MKGTGSTARSTVEASSPGATKTGECGVGIVAGAAQEQARQAAAEREAVWELCGCGS
jgi:hypothetical protein